MRYIDADKLQEDFKELHGGKRSLLIDTAPTADVRENVNGKWESPRDKIYTPDGRDTTFIFKGCSNCHALFPTIFSMNYCPSCGAEMRGEEEGSKKEAGKRIKEGDYEKIDKSYGRSIDFMFVDECCGGGGDREVHNKDG